MNRPTDRLKLSHCETLFVGTNIGNHRSNLVRSLGRLLRSVNPFCFKKLMPRNDVKAFTLAEVLITLGIIGVVAAMTLPTVMKNIQNQQNKVGAKKTFSILARAVEQFKYDNGGVIDSGHSSRTELLNLIKPYLSYTKSCDNVAAEGCMGDSYKYYNGSLAHSSWFPTNSGLILNDGSAIAVLNTYSSSCQYAYTASLSVCGGFLIDSNGAKGPNQYGVDTFITFLSKDKLIAAGADGAKNGDWDHDCSTHGFSCLQNVLSGINY